MKNRNLFFAIVMISFTSTFMSCQKEALLTTEIQPNQDIQLDYEIPYNNEVLQVKNIIDFETKNEFKFEIPINNEVLQSKNNGKINDINLGIPSSQTSIAIKITKDNCINGGVTLIAHNPRFNFSDHKYKFSWSISDNSSFTKSENVLSCACSGIYELHVIAQGEVIATKLVEVKSTCSSSINSI